MPSSTSILSLYLLTITFPLISSFHASSLLSTARISHNAAPIQPSHNKQIIPSITEKSRTITNVCVSGTLSTSTTDDNSPFGSYADYIVDDKGWPVMLLHEKSQNAINLNSNSKASLFCQLPSQLHYGQSATSIGRVTLSGDVERVPKAETSALKFAFPLVHPYAERLVNLPQYFFARLKPSRIHYTGGYGATPTWVDVHAYESIRPDILAQEVPSILPRMNIERQLELRLMCKHFLGLDHVDGATLHGMDRLGVDLRVQLGPYSDDYRIAFRYPVQTAEGAKSEMMKLFQECWERENTGEYYTSSLPDTLKHS